MRPDILVCIASGGRGYRLSGYVPALDNNPALSKGMAVIHKGKPLVSYQLRQIERTFDNVLVAMLFTQDESVHIFRRLVEEGMLPQLPYIFSLCEYRDDASGTGLFQEFVHREAIDVEDFSKVVFSSGDVLVSDDAYSQLSLEARNTICEKKVVAGSWLKSVQNMATVTDPNDKIIGFQEVPDMPDTILGHPISMQPRVASIMVREMAPTTSKRDLVMASIEKGYDFNLLRPDILINVNSVEDLLLLQALE